MAYKIAVQKFKKFLICLLTTENLSAIIKHNRITDEQEEYLLKRSSAESRCLVKIGVDGVRNGLARANRGYFGGL